MASEDETSGSAAGADATPEPTPFQVNVKPNMKLTGNGEVDELIDSATCNTVRSYAQTVPGVNLIMSGIELVQGKTICGEELTAEHKVTMAAHIVNPVAGKVVSALFTAKDGVDEVKKQLYPDEHPGSTEPAAAASEEPVLMMSLGADPTAVHSRPKEERFNEEVYQSMPSLTAVSSSVLSISNTLSQDARRALFHDGDKMDPELRQLKVANAIDQRANANFSPDLDWMAGAKAPKPAAFRNADLHEDEWMKPDSPA